MNGKIPSTNTTLGVQSNASLQEAINTTITPSLDLMGHEQMAQQLSLKLNESSSKNPQLNPETVRTVGMPPVGQQCSTSCHRTTGSLIPMSLLDAPSREGKLSAPLE